MFFIDIDDWMAQTASRIHARSDKLKLLDAAIRAANEIEESDSVVLLAYADGLGERSAAARSALDTEEAQRKLAVASINRAFSSWVADQTRKKQDWRSSTRNSSGAVTTLYNQLVYWRNRYPGEDTSAALAVLVEQRNKSIPGLFKDCECIPLNTLVSRTKDRVAKATAARNVRLVYENSAKLARGAKGAAKVVSTGASTGQKVGGALANITSHVEDLVRTAFGSSLGEIDWGPAETFFRDTLADAIDSIKEEVSALAPGIGLGVASATLVFHTAKLVMAAVAADAMLDLSRRLELGDSQSALQRVRDWQLRDIALRASKVARASVNVATQTAAIASCGVGIPAQLAIGIANAIIALAEVIADLGIQYKESRALTKYLNNDDIAHPLGADIFAAAPLAAAYYLLNTPTSHIALQLVVLGAPAWQEEVELLKKSGVLKTVIDESERLIGASRYRIVRKDGGRYRERMGKELKIKAKEKLGMSPLRGKVAMDSISSAGPPD